MLPGVFVGIADPTDHPLAESPGGRDQSLVASASDRVGGKDDSRDIAANHPLNDDPHRRRLESLLMAEPIGQDSAGEGGGPAAEKGMLDLDEATAVEERLELSSERGPSGVFANHRRAHRQRALTELIKQLTEVPPECLVQRGREESLADLTTDSLRSGHKVLLIRLQRPQCTLNQSAQATGAGGAGERTPRRRPQSSGPWPLPPQGLRAPRPCHRSVARRPLPSAQPDRVGRREDGGNEETVAPEHRHPHSGLIELPALGRGLFL